MRIDAFGPRTWLLATLAGWALLVWILALFGMGAQIRPLDDDPALVTALPRLSAQAPERLGPLSQYAEIASRPVFHPSRTPQPFFVSGQEQGEQTQAFDNVLSSVLITPQVQLAILQPTQGGEGIRLKVGEAPESAPGYRVVEIHPRSVLVQGPDGPRTLELRVFDGVGGQPVSAAPGATTAPGVPPASMQPGPAGTAPPMVTPSKPMPVSPAMPTVPTSATAAESMPEANPQTTEQQMEAIRQRIEARRAQLRQQGQTPPPQNKTK
jgi:general secretion pathway protein N